MVSTGFWVIVVACVMASVVSGVALKVHWMAVGVFVDCSRCQGACWMFLSVCFKSIEWLLEIPRWLLGQLGWL